MAKSSSGERWSRLRTPDALIAITAIVISVAFVGYAYVQYERRPAVSTESIYTPPVQKPLMGPFELPAPGSKMTVFGDSWALGYSARPDTDGFAFLTAQALEYRPNVIGVSGTGYINDGPSDTGNYVDRMRAEPVDVETTLLVLQGSLNDVTGLTRANVNARETITVAHEKFPNATIIVVGPSTDVLPVPPETVRLSRDLRAAAYDADAYFISPAIRNWITETNFGEYMDPVTMHPNNAGHRYLADQLAEAIRQLSVAGQA